MDRPPISYSFPISMFTPANQIGPKTYEYFFSCITISIIHMNILFLHAKTYQKCVNILFKQMKKKFEINLNLF